MNRKTKLVQSGMGGLIAVIIAALGGWVLNLFDVTIPSAFAWGMVGGVVFAFLVEKMIVRREVHEKPYRADLPLNKRNLNGQEQTLATVKQERDESRRAHAATRRKLAEFDRWLQEQSLSFPAMINQTRDPERQQSLRVMKTTVDGVKDKIGQIFASK